MEHILHKDAVNRIGKLPTLETKPMISNIRTMIKALVKVLQIISSILSQQCRYMGVIVETWEYILTGECL